MQQSKMKRTNQLGRAMSWVINNAAYPYSPPIEIRGETFEPLPEKNEKTSKNRTWKNTSDHRSGSIHATVRPIFIYS